MFSDKFKEKLKGMGWAYMFKDVWFRIFSDKPNYYSVNEFLKKCLDEKPEGIPIFNCKDEDKRVVEILRFVKKNIEYVSDNNRRKGSIRKVEHWQTPFETMYLKTGDCEDQAILIYCICKWSMVNPMKIRFVCGDVKTSSGVSGHAWTEYLADYDMDWYAMDSAYYFDFDLVPDRRSINTISMSNLYLKRWFKICLIGGIR